MSSAKFTELSREEKEEFAKKRMNEMKLKNEKILQRHAEVENDRINAESQNSAVTGAKVLSSSSSRRSVTNQNKRNEESKTEYAREWDRGKPNLDDWTQPEPARCQYRNFRGSGRYVRRDIEKSDNRNSKPRKESSEYSHHDRRVKGEYNADEQLNRGGWQNPPLKVPYNTYYKPGIEGDPIDDWNYGKEEKHSSDDWNVAKKDRHSSEHMDWMADKKNSYKRGYNKNEGREYTPDDFKSQDNWRSKPSDRNQHNSSRFQVSPRRTRGTGYRHDSHRKYQNYHSDDKFKKSDFKQSNSRKKYSHSKAYSRSSSKSESDGMENQFTLRTFNLWQNDKSNEDQTKQTRVEKWVKSVNKSNKSNMWPEKQSSEEKDNLGNHFSSVKPEESRRSLRIRISSERNSDEGDINLNTFEDMKINENKDVTCQQNDINTGSSPNTDIIKNTEQSNNKQNSGQNIKYSANSEYVKKSVGYYKRGFQSKQSPPFRSGGVSVYDNMSKPKKDTRSYKSDEVKNKFKFTPNNNSSFDDNWKSSRNENIVNQKREVNLKNVDTDGWNAVEADTDGLWAEAEQSNIKWNLSDDEGKMKELKENKEQKDQVELDDSRNKCIQLHKKNDLPVVNDASWGPTGSTNIQQQVSFKEGNVASGAVEIITLSDDLPDVSEASQSPSGSTSIHQQVSLKEGNVASGAVEIITLSDDLPDVNEASWGSSGSTSIKQQLSFKEGNVASGAVEIITLSDDLPDVNDASVSKSIQQQVSFKEESVASDAVEIITLSDDIPDVNDASLGTSDSTSIQQQTSFKEGTVASGAVDIITLSPSTDKYADVSTHEHDSDDGGWSTVSEEGEVE